MDSLSGEIPWRRVIEGCLRREIGAAPTPPPEQNLIETGVLDSMGWVSFIRALESATGASDLGSALTEGVPSLESVFAALSRTRPSSSDADSQSLSYESPAARIPVFLVSSSSATSSRVVPSEEVDRAFGMPAGKLRARAGVESLAYAAEGEDEVVLGTRAAQGALCAAGCSVQELDWIVATGETHRSYPSLAAQLHSGLLAREMSGALDVGGACLGLLNALAVAQALIRSAQARAVLVVTADVHSRILTPGRVAGEFGGLFGDGASAFLLRGATQPGAPVSFRLGEFFFGCAGQYAAAIRVAGSGEQNLEVHFDGEALSRAAITRLEKVILDLELRSGIARTALAGLATHQPNPRLLALLAKQCNLPEDKFPAVARRFGNLGSSTCGVALDVLLQHAASVTPVQTGPVFLASLGPGLLFGGGWLNPS